MMIDAGWQAVVTFVTWENAICFLMGTVLLHVLNILRKRIKTIRYTVTHDRVALSADDQIFGDVRVTWQGNPVLNLFMSTIRFENATGVDLVNLTFKANSPPTTLILNGQTTIENTPYAVHLSETYQELIRVEAGEEPTLIQLDIHRHSREFMIPTLNRGQTVSLKFLTIDRAGDGPSIWLAAQHPGLKFEFQPSVPMFGGVPIKYSLPCGLVVCSVVLAISGYYTENWWFLVACFMAGFAAQILGAMVFKFFRSIWGLILS